MPQSNLNLMGRVMDLIKHQGIAGLRVEAQNDFVAGSAMTDDRGGFKITFDQSQHPELFKEDSSDFVFTFNIFEGEMLVKTTEEAVPRDTKGSPFEIIIMMRLPDDGARNVVKGTVRRYTGEMVGVGSTQAFHESDSGAIFLGKSKIDSKGRYTIAYASTIVQGGIKLLVRAYDENEKMMAESSPVTAPKRNEIINIVLQPVVDSETQFVEGQIFFDHGLPAEGISLRLYNRGFGCAEVRLGETKTDTGGFYSLPYSLRDAPANLEVRAVDAQGKEVSLSATKYKAQKKEVMNLVAPASVRPLAAEFQRLNDDLGKHLIGRRKLGEARENAECQDLTFLYQATGWDARVIALAATADKISADTRIPQEALYGLFRVGLPSDTRQLAQVDADDFEKALARAADAGIIKLNDKQMAKVRASFENFARESRRTVKSPGAPSTFGDLLNASSLTNDEKQAFENIYFSHQGSGDELWQKAREVGIPDEKVNGMQLQGKLAYLTINNAGLMLSLQQEIGSPDRIAQLVDKDLYKADEWKSRLLKAANNNEQALEKIIPPAFTGNKTAERLDAYAQDLARKVRMSFPTQVVARRIERDELRLGARHDELKAPVGKFLRNADELGFRFGKVALGRFIRENEDKLFRGIEAKNIEPMTQEVKKLQRLYQITPTDEAMKVLLDLGFTSAHDVALLGYDNFRQSYGDRFAQEKEVSFAIAELIYRKAQQVSVVMYNFFTLAKQMESAPAIYSISAPPEAVEAAKVELIKNYPTMETLFGSLDFCECEHCRSVLSPAAYLVDLLQFLDPEQFVWDNFLSDWKSKHNGKAYTAKYMKPYDALVERRPDLPHLPLTCENTNTALPYIDVVNEILEYYVAKGKLAPDAAQDTGDATTPELLAEPQNIMAEAYDKLSDAQYPLALPFDLWLENVRRFYDYSETPLWQVLEVFRPADEVFPPAANPESYYRSKIFAESLEISPSEYAIFTDADSQSHWHELYGYTTKAGALAELRSAKTLSRRLGVSYKDLIGLVSTAFVNPRLNALVILRKLGVDTRDVFRYKGHAVYPAFTKEDKDAFEAQLDEVTETFQASGFNARTWLDTAYKGGAFDQILVLADPDTGCSFDLTTLRYADGTDAKDIDFIKLNLFVRLWKKLGWTIDETDRALRTFMPADSLAKIDDGGLASAVRAAALGPAFETALLYLAHLKMLDGQVKAGKNSRTKLLTLWSKLPATGSRPLYAELFLTRSVLKNDLVFDDPLGNYLSKPGIMIKDHLLALQGALNLTADEVARILDDAGTKLDLSELSLASVSLLYRYGLLAKALKLSVRDLIALKGLSGLDPFKPLKPDTVKILEDDYPFTQTLGFVEIVAKVKESGFKIEDIDYLLRHSFDPVGKYRPNPESALALVKLLSAEFHRTETENAVASDPASLTDEMLRQKIALVMPSDVAETFLAMWTGTVEYAAAQDAPPGDALDPADFEKEPELRVSYDEVRQQQRLFYRGVLIDAKKAAIIANNSSPLLPPLLDHAQAPSKEFFSKYLEKTAIGDQSIGFINAAEFDLLFEPVGDNLSEAEKQEQMRKKREKLAGAFLPFVQQRLNHQFVIRTLTVMLNADPALVEALLTESRLLTDPTEPSKPVIEAFAAANTPGASATFYASDDGSGVPLEARHTATADIKGAPANAKSARLEGYFEVPSAGAYRFFAVFGKKGVEAELRIDRSPDPLLRDKATVDGAEISAVVELKPGVPYHFMLDARNLDGDVSLLVQGENLLKGTLSRLTLYPAAVVERVARAQVLLAKTIQLSQGLPLSEREVRYLLTHGEDFDQLDLSKLPTREADDSTAGAAALFKQFLRLAGYARLKRDLAEGTDDLIGVFENARRTHPELADANQAMSALLADLYKRFADLTRREVDTVKTAATQLGFAAKFTVNGGELLVEAPDFAQEKGIRRLWDALQVVERLGITAQAIANSTGIISDAKSGDERSNIARDLRNTVKARYEPETWQRIAQPIFDQLRRRQREALVAYIMHRDGFDRMEQLFEYFLIDPGMEPVVRTSRLRLAISSLQLFIQRCLLNLEPKVHPSSLNSNHWQWMKRYRVWEANRKIFLFPENWLEPEFRDDKTHLFQELESALLQGDLSNEMAEDAFFKYLKNLEELARLDIVTMYCEEQPLDPASNTLHVIGRTFSLPHKYFYRRFAHQMWTPWEPVAVDIEGDHVAAVIWRQRLHLFWVTFVDQAKDNSGTKNDSASNKSLVSMSLNDLAEGLSARQPKKEVQVQLNWTEYFQGEWTAGKASGLAKPITVEVYNDFDSRQVFIFVNKEYEDGEERAIKIQLSGEQNVEGFGSGGVFKGANKWKTAFRVVSKHSEPQVVIRTPLQPPDPPYARNGVEATQYTGSGALEVSFLEKIDTSSADGRPVFTWANEDILRKGESFSLLTCSNPLELFSGDVGFLVTPFFYKDSLHTFFVEPTLTETTLEKWEDWVVPPVKPGPILGDWLKDIPLYLEVPSLGPHWPEPDPLARFQIDRGDNWLTNVATVIEFDDHLIGRGGGIEAPALPAVAGVNDAARLSGPAGAGSSVLTVIGASGLNSALLKNMKPRKI
ncbi:MAG TPA: neuraminidase-like domain-containing protein [Blastocatellia bacterium]|nr:neuraminidase-like domain-containing protein [Blastocatellia bacterium]